MAVCALSRQGVRVHGIDLYPPTVARLQTKPGADGVDVRIWNPAGAS
jgi:hypothetical protein